MKKLSAIFLVSSLFFVVALVVQTNIKNNLPKGPDDGDILGWSTTRIDKTISTVSKSFFDNFETPYSLIESGNMKTSPNGSWWLNSGGVMDIGSGTAKSIQGELPALSNWRLAYSLSNPEDTDNGYHPQNILRLVTRTKWKNYTQQAYFKVNKDNLSSSPNRNESNGLFLFNRYVDGMNLYYTGLRVDGAVVIKKKTKGNYYTMAYQKYLPGIYNKSSSADLIPKNIWLGLKSELTTLANGNVDIKFYLDSNESGQWVKVLQVLDDGKKFGGATINLDGFAGIRTDFMDVEIKNFSITATSGP